MRTIPRYIVGTLVIAGLLIAAACTPAAAPAPVSSPAKPAVPAASEAKPAAPAPSASEKPAAGSDWKAEWDKTLAAAKQEGKVVVAGGRSESYRLAAEEFQKAYPDIKVEYSGMVGADFSPKIIGERNAGQYLWDVHMGGATTIVSQFKPQGILDPLKPTFLLPEVLDNSKWVGGLDDGWMDNEHQYVLHFDGTVGFLAHVNREVVKESELNSIDQLLDPKWKGKITILDPRINGTGGTAAGTILMARGEDWLRKFLSQDLVLAPEARQQAESTIRGRTPIAIRINLPDIQYFAAQGLTASLKPLDPTGPAGAAIAVGYGSLALINRAPHPNASKVFINWWLSKDGQSSYARVASSNSRRLDVQGPAETTPDPKIKYIGVGKEANVSFIQRAKDIAKEIIR